MIRKESCKLARNATGASVFWFYFPFALTIGNPQDFLSEASSN